MKPKIIKKLTFYSRPDITIYGSEKSAEIIFIRENEYNFQLAINETVYDFLDPFLMMFYGRVILSSIAFEIVV